MIAYYKLVEDLNDTLIADEDINTVTVGLLSHTDLIKQTIFPMANVFINTAQRINGVIRFNLTVTVMDIVDINNDNPTKDAETWKGYDNKQDIYNTMYGVIENLDRAIDRGVLYDEGYEVQGNLVASPFEDFDTNLLVGWSTSIDLDIPNTVQNCVIAIPPIIEGTFDLTFDNTFN